MTRTLGTFTVPPVCIMPGSDNDLCSNAGYCFVEFTTPEAATKALGLNGTPVPNSSRQFKLNWASGGGLVDRR